MSKKGISPIEIFIVVLYDHSTHGSSFAQCPFDFFQSFLQRVNYGFVCGFSFSIRLRVSWSCEVQLDVPFDTEVLELVAYKL